MLPRFVYEVIPYACLIAGIAIVLMINNPLTYISGALFYIAGTAIWVKRSTHRRNQRIDHNPRYLRKRSAQQKRYLPEIVYETLPFVYIGAGIAVVAVNRDAISGFFALLFFSAGAVVLLARSQYRRSLG